MKIDSTASDISAHDIAAMLPTGKWLEGECISLQQTFATGDIFFFFSSARAALRSLFQRANFFCNFLGHRPCHRPLIPFAEKTREIPKTNARK
jgi:hypothetical protein